jgi:hypothetical protein
MNDAQRVQLMLETDIDLAMAGFAIADVLRAFAQVREFRALGRDSYPMCRALTGALVGERLDPNTMERFGSVVSPKMNSTSITSPSRSSCQCASMYACAFPKNVI